MKALERRQALIELLCERRHDKIGNLAFEFGVNEKTIRRDIQELSLSYPIYTECSRGKAGVYIEESYYLGKQYLQQEEEKLIIKIHKFESILKKWIGIFFISCRQRRIKRLSECAYQAMASFIRFLFMIKRNLKK